jgi:hypothetical protein
MHPQVNPQPRPPRSDAVYRDPFDKAVAAARRGWPDRLVDPVSVTREQASYPKRLVVEYQDGENQTSCRESLPPSPRPPRAGLTLSGFRRG